MNEILGGIERVLDEIDDLPELEDEFDRLAGWRAENGEPDQERSSLELKKWRVKLQNFHDGAGACFEKLASMPLGGQLELELRRKLMGKAEQKKESIQGLLPKVDMQIEIFESFIRRREVREQVDLTRRALDEARRANSIAQEGVHVANESTDAAKMSANAAMDSAEIARKGTMHTGRAVWVAACSAAIAAVALCWQIYSQNKVVSVNLNSPVGMQPVTLSDESISNLTHALSAELAKAKGEQAALSPKSIEDLRAVLKLELERNARIDVVKSREYMGQKEN